jgi:DNA-damage-inducible protein J
MPKSPMIRARVEPDLKERAEAMLEELGLSPTTAITLFYRQVVQSQGLPFRVRIPNAATRRAMRDAEADRNLIRAGSMDELRSKLDAADERRRPRSRKRRVRSTR